MVLSKNTVRLTDERIVSAAARDDGTEFITIRRGEAFVYFLPLKERRLAEPQTAGFSKKRVFAKDGYYEAKWNETLYIPRAQT